MAGWNDVVGMRKRYPGHSLAPRLGSNCRNLDLERVGRKLWGSGLTLGILELGKQTGQRVRLKSETGKESTHSLCGRATHTHKGV